MKMHFKLPFRKKGILHPYIRDTLFIFIFFIFYVIPIFVQCNQYISKCSSDIISTSIFFLL